MLFPWAPLPVRRHPAYCPHTKGRLYYNPTMIAEQVLLYSSISLAQSQAMSIRDLESSRVSKLVLLTGIITSASRPKVGVGGGCVARTGRGSCGWGLRAQIDKNHVGGGCGAVTGRNYKSVYAVPSVQEANFLHGQASIAYTRPVAV